MVEQNKETPGRGGAIINMSSVNGVTAIPSIAGYNSAKGGVNNLTRYQVSFVVVLCVCGEGGAQGGTSVHGGSA